MFIIRNNDNGKYASQPGSEHSYTRSLEQAQVFRTRVEAERHKCENETILPLESLLQGLPRF